MRAAALLLALVGAFAAGSALAGGFNKGSSGSFNKGSSASVNRGSSTSVNTGSGFAHSHGHHHHQSVAFFGSGFTYPWWYYPPPYYYPYYQPVVYESEPTNYVEQSSTPAVEPTGWWYYCDASRGYYPYVKECPSGWQRVPAVPPPRN